MSQDRPQTQASCPESEELAALIDGTIAAHERQRLLRHVEGCPFCFEVFSETARYSLETSDQGADVVTFGAPVRSRDATPDWRKWAFAAAAGLSILMVGLFLWLALPDQSPVQQGGGQAVMRTSAEPLDLQQLWPNVDLPRVSIFQPPAIAGFASTSSETQRSFRLGVYLTDLNLAVRLGDIEGAKAALEQLARVAGSEDPERATEFETVRQRLEEKPEFLPMAFLVAVGPLAGEVATDPQRFGRWAELGRLASGAGASMPLAHPSFLRTLDTWLAQASGAEVDGEGVDGEGVDGEGADGAGVGGGASDTPLVAELRQVRKLLTAPPTQRADFRRLEKSFETVLLLGGFAG